MNPFPGNQSVLLLDNCKIHKSDQLREAIGEKGLFVSYKEIFNSQQATGCVLKYIPPYSPDLNPIEESFSAGKVPKKKENGIITKYTLVKSWIQREYGRLVHSENPAADLYEACGVVTAEKARQWFNHSGYR
jgi:transposase